MGGGLKAGKTDNGICSDAITNYIQSDLIKG